MKTKILLLVVLLGLTSNTLANVIIYPGVNYYAGDLTVSFLETTDLSYFAIGETYVALNRTNLSMSVTQGIHLNISDIDDSGTELANNETVLRFNATYSGGSVTFNYYHNLSYKGVYDVYVDDVLRKNNEENNFTFILSGWSTKDIDIRFQGYRPDPPYDVPGDNSTWDKNTQRVNLSWHSGNYSNRDVVFARNDTYPTSPSDGNAWRVGNYSVNDSNYHNESATLTRYYTVWSWNSTSNLYSTTGLNLPWGGMHIWVFNETSPSEQITDWGLLITDAIGDNAYQDEHITNTVYFDIGSIPNGTQTLFVINASKYRDSTYYKNILPNSFYNFTFYLAPVIAHGEPQDPPTTNETQTFYIKIINRNNNPIEGVKVTVRFFDDNLDKWATRASGLTDGSGIVPFDLRVGDSYKINVTDDSGTYENITGQDFKPIYEQTIKEFMMEYKETPVFPPVIEPEEIIYGGYISGTVLYVNYTDNMEMTTNTTIFLYETDPLTGTTVLFDTDTRTGESDFQAVFYGVNTSREYLAVLHYNHTQFGHAKKQYLFQAFQDTFTTQSRTDSLFNAVYGYNPFGWTNTIMWIFLLICFFSFGQRGSGVALVFSGGLLLFINNVVGFNTTFSIAAGGIIPVLFVIVGIMVVWKHRKREGGQG